MTKAKKNKGDRENTEDRVQNAKVGYTAAEDHIRRYRARNSIGRRRLKIILESLIRAILKSVPRFGSAIDQIIFETMHALKNSEVIEILENIENDLLKVIDIESMSGIKQEDLLRRIENSSEQLIIVVEQISKKLEDLDPQNLRTLIKEVTALERRYGGIKESEILTHESRKIAEKLASNIHHDTKREMSECKLHIDAFLNRIEKARKLDASNLRRIMLSLEEDTSHRILLETAKPCRRAVELMKKVEIEMGFKTILTVDFSEIHNYSYTLFRTDRFGYYGSAFAIYLLKTSENPYFLLPGTLAELKNHLDYLSTRFFDYHTLRESFLKQIGKNTLENLEKSRTLSLEEKIILLSSLGSRNTPFNRIKGLLDERIIIPMPASELPKCEDEIFRRALEYFRTVRPKNSVSNYYDALNIACLEQLNHDSLEQKRLFCHVTSSPKTKIAATHAMQEYFSTFGDLGFDPSTLVLEPQECAFRCYLKRQWRHGDRPLGTDLFHLVDNYYELMQYFEEKRSIISSQMNFPNADTLIGLANYFSSLADSLKGCYGRVINPFHDSVYEVELSDAGVIFPESKSWLNEFDNVYERVLDEITELMIYLRPLAESFNPFLELAHQERIVDESKDNRKPLFYEP